MGNAMQLDIGPKPIFSLRTTKHPQVPHLWDMYSFQAESQDRNIHKVDVRILQHYRRGRLGNNNNLTQTPVLSDLVGWEDHFQGALLYRGTLNRLLSM
jgi:hypothetical protein